MDEKRDELTLVRDEEGLALVGEGQMLRGDFTRMLPRIKAGRLNSELLVKAAKIKKAEGELTAVDATAGLGEDSLLLAAAGFNVTLYERNPVVYELLKDALERAAQIPELAPVVARMTAVHADSVAGMASLETPPDVILLDPMFPARQKSALVKKKLQMIQKLEQPCDDEITLLLTAMEAKPKKLIVKRPPKGDYLAGLKPDHSIEGKAVRFDCFASPYDRLEKFKEKLK
jgi:16S rRNA (guanine1516-N2)-methyltransferase